MRLHRYRVRTLLAAVALVAVVLGVGLESVRLKRLSNKYRYIAHAFGENARGSLGQLGRVRPIFEKMQGSPDADRAKLIEYAHMIQWLEADVAANVNLVQIYEHAASHPWEAPPKGLAVTRGLDRDPLVRRFLGPPPPPPPTPPEFAQPTIPEPPPPPPPPPQGQRPSQSSDGAIPRVEPVAEPDR